MIHYNIILPSTPVSSKSSLPFSFPTKIFYSFLISPICATCSAQLILLNMRFTTCYNTLWRHCTPTGFKMSETHFINVMNHNRQEFSSDSSRARHLLLSRERETSRVWWACHQLCEATNHFRDQKALFNTAGTGMATLVTLWSFGNVPIFSMTLFTSIKCCIIPLSWPYWSVSLAGYVAFQIRRETSIQRPYEHAWTWVYTELAWELISSINLTFCFIKSVICM